MKINVDFTIAVEAKDLPALRELAEADTIADAILFVKAEAQESLVGYLTDNGVPVTVSRDSATTY